MSAVASIDGVIVPLDTLGAARVSVLDRGFLYGDAVFEALRTYRGVPDALDLHLARLEQSCAILHIAPPASREQLAREVVAAVAATGAPECYLRIMITRGDLPDALPPMGAGQARRVILARPLAPSAPTVYRDGIRVVSTVAPPSPLWAGAKPSAYLNNLLAVGAAQRAGAADALLLGAYGELLEGATSSVFVVRAGQVSTPPLALGILPGITRDRVLACAESEGLSPRERLLFIHDAYAADEVFLTSSVRTVVPVVAVDGIAVGDGKPGPITQRLAAAYRALVERL